MSAEAKWPDVVTWLRDREEICRKLGETFPPPEPQLLEAQANFRRAADEIELLRSRLWQALHGISLVVPSAHPHQPEPAKTAVSV